MYKLIKQTLLKRTGNRRNYKDWERFIIYICDKKLGLEYSFYTGRELWEKESREEDIEKFEKWIKDFEKEENKMINKEFGMLLNPELDDFGR